MVLRRTPRAVTPFGGLSVFIEFLGRTGFAKHISGHLPIHLKSPNAAASAKAKEKQTIALHAPVALRAFPFARFLIAQLPKLAPF